MRAERGPARGGRCRRDGPTNRCVRAAMIGAIRAARGGAWSGSTRQCRCRPRQEATAATGGWARAVSPMPALRVGGALRMRRTREV